MALRLRIVGLVQGVGFRDYMVREAATQGVSGWVRNRRDGSVEVFAIGPTEALDAIKAAARRGPRAARVIRVDADPANAADWPGEQGFRMLPTV